MQRRENDTNENNHLSWWEWAGQNQPIQFTGFLRHCGYWLFGTKGDIVYTNPSFQPAFPDDKGTAIYCIHGTGDRNASFSLHAERMMPKLPNHISSIRLVSFTNRYQGVGIENFAGQLRARIQKNGHTNIILDGHSRGGLVALFYAAEYAPLDNVTIHAAFCICTPLQGSSLAIAPATWVSTSISQMQINSPFLQDLNNKLKSATFPIHCIITENDSLVSINNCCPSDAPHQPAHFDRHGHCSVMGSNRVPAHIAHMISSLPVPSSAAPSPLLAATTAAAAAATTDTAIPAAAIMTDASSTGEPPSSTISPSP